MLRALALVELIIDVLPYIWVWWMIQDCILCLNIFFNTKMFELIRWDRVHVALMYSIGMRKDGCPGCLQDRQNRIC